MAGIGSVILSSLKHGAEVGATTSVTKAVVKMAKDKIGDFPGKDFLETPLGQALEPVIFGGLFVLIGTRMQSKIPQAQAFALAGERLLEAGGRDVVERLGDFVMPMARQLAESPEFRQLSAKTDETEESTETERVVDLKKEQGRKNAQRENATAAAG